MLGLVERAGGGRALKLGVTEPPQQGRANLAAIALLAKAWRLPKGDFAVVAGAASRDKTLLLRGSAESLLLRLEAWLAALPNVAGVAEAREQKAPLPGGRQAPVVRQGKSARRKRR
ncbi:MAG: DUF167 family protein [Kiloniellales bacterium]